jgi:hypothetical protein
MVKFNKNRLMMGGMLLVLIAIGETILHEFDLPAWPPLFVMLFFFLSHMDKKAAPNIIIGALVGIGCFIIARPIVVAIAPITGAATGRLLFILAIVAAVVLFREMAPMVFNDYAFAFLLIAGLASKNPDPPDPYVLMAVTLIGGSLFIAAILGMRKTVEAMARKRAAKKG